MNHKIIAVEREETVFQGEEDVKAAAREPTLGEALDRAGFKPHRRPRIIVSEGRKRKPLRRIRPQTAE